MHFIKKLIFSLLLLITFKELIPMKSTSWQSICQHDKYLKLTNGIRPDTTIFAFDLHDVVFSKSYRTIACSTFNALRRGMFWYALNPCFLFKGIRLAMQGRIWEDTFYTLANDYPGLLNFEEDFFNISNSCCEPISQMVQVVEQLKALGYKLFLLSNIGCKSYNHFKSKFSNVMSLFDGTYLPSKENNYHHKPHKEYYLGFMSYLKQMSLEDKQIIFIDDLCQNLDGAFEVGISGIHCKSTDCVINKLKQLSVIK